ncbi:hypothetical protein AB1K54_16905 [Microbacterium sp. BWT-B31]|uniref:hypothetical protein n=1 Tax=Microbacterium sp. BWT-B31 TaxID=3232072 RepID=UPI003528CE0E
MTRLNFEARETLRAEGFTTKAWAQLNGYAGAAEWRGDECGCTDDRCIGYHHDENEECGCLPALIEEQRRQERATARGCAVWAAHLNAEQVGTPEDRAHADELAAAWITEFHPGAVSYSLTESPRGITYRNQWNNTTWLIFDAATQLASVEALEG